MSVIYDFNDFNQFNADNFLDGLETEMKNLSEAHQEALHHALGIAQNNRDLFYIQQWLFDPITWKIPQVSVDTFLDNKDYLGLGDKVYKEVRNICRSIIEGGYREGVEVAGIWSWKSFSAEILACYAAHYLLCLNDPHGYYGLANDKNISILNMGTSATQAWEVVFSGIKNLMGASRFFQQFHPNILATSIRFENEKVLLACWNSKATTPLGYNVFYAILDEAAFYLDKDDNSVAQDIYESLQRRIISRFWNDGLLMMISSPRYTWDFIMRKLAQAKELDSEGNPKYTHIYHMQLPTWKVKGMARVNMEGRFFFHARKAEILEESEEEIKKVYKINYVATEWFWEEWDVREIPGEYKPSFQQNPEKAKRDFWATPSETLAWFFPNPAIVTECYNTERENPLVAPATFKFTSRPLRVPYYIHIDIWLNRDWKWDHCGFCMWHFGGWTTEPESGEMRMKLVIDVMEQIWIEEKKGEIDLSEVRNRVYDLRAMGYNIRLVTLDGYMSKDFMQILKKKGYNTDYVSVDRTVDPYNILKEAIYEKRIDIPYYEIFDIECKGLELIKWIKVDHSPNSSKDVSDAVAWVCWNIIENTSTFSAQMQAVSMSNEPNTALAQHAQFKAKEREIRLKQRIIEKRDAILNKIQ